jgi:hypothetical protein
VLSTSILPERNSQKLSLLQTSSFASCAGQLTDWPHLDGAYASGRDLRGDLDSFVQVGGVNQIETSQEFLCFGERAVPDGHFSVADAYDGSGMSRLKSLGGQALAPVAEGLVVRHAVIVGHGRDFLLSAVDEA